MSSETTNANLSDQMTEMDRASLLNETDKQEEELQKEIKNQPLVSRKTGISSLQQEYTAAESPEFLQKSKDLATKFQWLRRVRGDGNCMYRGIAFSILENLIGDIKGIEKLKGKVSDWKERLLKLGFPDMTTEDFVDTFLELLSEVRGKLPPLFAVSPPLR